MIPQDKIGPPLRVAALISGKLTCVDLWTLRKMYSVPCELCVVQAKQASGASPRKRLRWLVREYGLLGACSRLLGRLVGSPIIRRDNELLEEMFNFEDLQQWWKRTGITTVSVTTLNHAESQAALSRYSPDILVRVSGGILKPSIFSLSRLATLNIHHGQAPQIRGMWSIPWGIVEGRSDWIGATIHIIDQGIDTGGVLWRGGPQLAPGDTNVDLLFRTHLEAVDALVTILKSYSKGDNPKVWPSGAGGISTYRSAPGIWNWLRLLYLGRGRRASVLLERGIAC